MDQTSAIPRPSGIPRPSSSRLPVLRSTGSLSQLRPHSSTEQLRKRPSIPTIPRANPPISQQTPTPAPAPLRTKTSRASLVRSNTPSATSTAAPAVSSNRRTSFVPSSNRRASGIPSFGSKPPGSATPATDPAFKRPFARPPSRQTSKPAPQPPTSHTSKEDDALGSLDAFRSASRASSRAGSRAGFHDHDDADHVLEDEPEPATTTKKKSRPSLSERTVESLAHLPSSPAGRLSMTVPGKRSISANVTPVATPSRTPSTVRPLSTIKKQPLALSQNLQTTSRPRPLSDSKSMVARTPKPRPSLGNTFGQAVSPPGAAKVGPATPSQGPSIKRTPSTARLVSNSSTALREQIAKAKATRKSEVVDEPMAKSPKAGASSNALREQIAKAREAARRAKTELTDSEAPSRTAIVPDPDEIATFDFGLDDPFNQQAKGSKSLLRKRIDGARVDGRLNIAAMGLKEFPDEVMQMYKYDPNDTTVAWGEIVDLTSIIAADNELELLSDAMFPDVDIQTMIDSDEGGPQFGGVQNIDLHGNELRELPVGLKRLTQLSRLNLSRNKLTIASFDIICQIPSLRELKLAENALEGDLPAVIGDLMALEVLELQSNKLTGLPNEVRQLTCLRMMNVSSNQLSSLPMGLFETNLIELVANKNSFKGAFFTIGSIPHLQELNISNNSLTKLCDDETIELPALKSINISTNRLTSLPSVETWVNLQSLAIAENKLTAFPEGFTSLAHLRTADFTANDISQIDERIAFMSLEHLTLAANPLRERKFLTMSFEDMKRNLSSRLTVAADSAADNSVVGKDGGGADDEPVSSTPEWQVTPSGTLDLSAKSLTELDESALEVFVDNIRQLYLQQNAFTSIPASLSQITYLTVLDLSKNNLEVALTSPLNLSKLKELRLNSNKLTSLEPLVSNLSAPSLQTLDVSNNRLTGALPLLRPTFPDLASILASDNTITEVSAESLTGIKIANFSNNDIERLEPHIGLLNGTLTSLNVEGNKFRVPNYQVLQKGTESVLNWLRDRIPRESWKSDATEFFDADDGETF
ncbi:hypothetical protein GQ44DRAFT_613433 [Phaeosphaeriaceae sp. PMI808]|nr:hypothetical protein GQ44DRAFT_613433 [Phaeosphaeriaceae sp. PMI808]